MSPKLRREWEAFRAALEARLEVGAREYGDISLLRSPGELAGEVEQELLDVSGWGFLLWRRMRELREKLEDMK